MGYMQTFEVFLVLLFIGQNCVALYCLIAVDFYKYNSIVLNVNVFR